MNNWIYFSCSSSPIQLHFRHACPPALGWMMKRPIPYTFSVRFVPYFPTGSLGYIGIWFWVSLIPIPRIWYIVVEQKVALILYQRWLVEQKACCCVHFWALAIANPPKNRRFDLLRGCRGTGHYLRRLWGDVAWLEHAGAKVGCDMGLPSCSKSAVFNTPVGWWIIAGCTSQRSGDYHNPLWVIVATSH